MQYFVCANLKFRTNVTKSFLSNDIMPLNEILQNFTNFVPLNKADFYTIAGLAIGDDLCPR